jgi:hypothetical protein
MFRSRFAEPVARWTCREGSASRHLKQTTAANLRLLHPCGLAETIIQGQPVPRTGDALKLEEQAIALEEKRSIYSSDWNCY